MTTEYMTWLGTGILGKSWNFGRLDGTQAVCSWPLPHRGGGRGGGGGGILPQCVSVFVCVWWWWWWWWAFGTSSGSWPRTMTGLQCSDRQAGRQAHMWLKSKQRAGSLWALEQIWHIQIVQMIIKAGNLYLCPRIESKVSAQLIYHLKSKKKNKNVKPLKKEICEGSLGLLYFGTASFSHFLLMSNMQRFSRSTWELLLTELNDTIHIIAFLELAAVRPGVIPRLESKKTKQTKVFTL